MKIYTHHLYLMCLFEPKSSSFPVGTFSRPEFRPSHTSSLVGKFVALTRNEYALDAGTNQQLLEMEMDLLQLAATWYMLEGKLPTGTSKTNKIQIYLDEVALFWMSKWAA